MNLTLCLLREDKEIFTCVISLLAAVSHAMIANLKDNLLKTR